VVTPEHYAIRIESDLSRFVFHGEETIHVRVNAATDRITLNAKELKIDSASVTVGSRMYNAKISENKAKEELTLGLPCRIRGGAALHITFSGCNNAELYGFYRSSYEYKGKKRCMLTTQFEPNDARAAFPCFDEPALKATFSLSLIIGNSLSAISNMPIKKESSAGDGKKLVEFARTPRMSSYLLYFGVGNFERMTKRIGKIEVGAVTVPGRIKQAKMALGFAVKFIEFYQNYFRIRYPLPKIDLIAAPDFAAGAMENWGAITFREVAMLGDEKTSAMRAKEIIATTIAHELAHQWFGDLVTMKWWDDLWLNESFATFMACKAVDSVFPGWKMSDQYLIDTVSSALSSDQLISTHPINVHVKKPAEIEQIFDDISYDKGGSVLYMLEDYVGQDVFRRGLHNYLSKKAYSNATKSDLWNEIDAEARKSDIKDVELVARKWIEVPGYPLIEASRSGSTLRLVQSRLTLSKTINGQVWPIPLSYMMQNGFQGKKLMLGRTVSMGLGSNRWVKLNHSQAGFYRASYPEDILEKLGGSIRSGIITDRDAWGIVNDLFFMARSGRIPARKYLNFVAKYCTVDEQLLNISVLSHLQWLCTVLDGTRMQDEVYEVATSYGNMLLKRLTWHSKRSDNNITTLLRGASISLLGLVGDKKVVERSEAMFYAFIKEGKQINPDLCTHVYMIVVRSDPKTYDTMKRLYAEEGTPEEKRRLLIAIGSASDPIHLKNALSFSISKAVRLQDSLIVLSSESNHPEAHAALWKWVKQNWKSIVKRYPLGMHRRFVELFGSVKDRRIYADMKRFFGAEGNMQDEIRMSVMQTLERIEANIAFLEKNA
jgi:tricorn protease interacting factor F2/3